VTPGNGAAQGFDVAIIETGTANLASVANGLRRAGAVPRLACDADDVARADRVVLPGVGSFGAAMQRLHDDGMVETIRDRVCGGRPLLAVCVGMQVLAASSEEAPGCPGIGIIEGAVTRFAGAVRVPQIGWNRVRADGCALLADGHAYFANSYRLIEAPAGAAIATAEHGGRFIAAIEMAGGALLACQFHPELSGAWGLALLRRWLSANGGAAC